MAATHYSKNDVLFPLAGGCACGLIRYQLAQAPLLVHCCHCTACQRQTGSAFALNAIIESTSVVLLPSAKPTIAGSVASPDPTPAGLVPAFASTTDATIPALADDPAANGDGQQPAAPKPLPVCLPSGSGFGTTLVRCPSCYTGLWTYYGDGGPHVSYVRVGTLDKPWAIEPDVHIYTHSRRDFISISDGKPQFEGYYPSREEFLREDALKRVEVLKPAIDQWRDEIKAAMTL